MLVLRSGFGVFCDVGVEVGTGVGVCFVQASCACVGVCLVFLL